MKKIILLLPILLIGLIGCQMSSSSDVKEIQKNITYFRDDSTGICFASINSWTHAGHEVTSIACVPCELAFPKKINVDTLKQDSTINKILEINKKTFRF